MINRFKYCNTNFGRRSDPAKVDVSLASPVLTMLTSNLMLPSDTSASRRLAAWRMDMRVDESYPSGKSGVENNDRSEVTVCLLGCSRPTHL